MGADLQYPSSFSLQYTRTINLQTRTSLLFFNGHLVVCPSDRDSFLLVDPTGSVIKECRMPDANAENASSRFCSPALWVNGDEAMSLAFVRQGNVVFFR